MNGLGFIDLVVIGLATWQAVEVAHHGEIFALARAVAEARRVWVDRLFLCPLCLSVWTATILAAFWVAPSPMWVDSFRHLVAVSSGALRIAGLVVLLVGLIVVSFTLMAAKLFVLGLALSRLANLANDLGRPVCRTPGRSSPPEARPTEQYE